jgi:formate hydrogenlyase subunit 3/multisubunit Na+/H+ antiporter MnhD subunit
MDAVPPPREPRLAIGTAEHYSWLHGIVKTVLVLNLLDAVFTLLWVRAGLAREANLMIDRLVEHHAIAFITVKLGLVGMGSWLLWSQRDRPTAVVAIFVAFLVYYLVLLYHLQYAATLVRSLFA